jgi:hypothetical protein
MLAAATIAAASARADDSRPAKEPRLDLWQEILAARVGAKGEVAYRTLDSIDRERLESFIASLAHAALDRLDGAESVALWINAYNAGVLWGVLHGGRPDTVRGRARLYSWLEIDVGGKRRTLDGIHAELARWAAADPRIHLALANGAKGGPTLSREPFEADRLEEQLARAAREFVNDPEKNRTQGGRPALSPLFFWYRADFTREARSIGTWVAKRLDDDDAADALTAEEAVPAFLEFDWRLNAAPGEAPSEK